jgi:hypothetical protein
MHARHHITTALSPSTSTSSSRSELSLGKALFLTPPPREPRRKLRPARAHHDQPLWCLPLPLLTGIASCLGPRDAHASLRSGHRGRSWPVHPGRRRRTRHRRRRALSANPRKPVVHQPVWIRVGSKMVALASPAGSPVVSFAVTFASPARWLSSRWALLVSVCVWAGGRHGPC